jgi:hypothetical protein
VQSLEHVMWGFQSHFQLSAEIEAEGVFKKLDPRLQPKVFLVGLPIRGRGQLPVCVVPANCRYQPPAFAQVEALAHHFEAGDPEWHALPAHPVARGDTQRRVHLRALRRAVQECVEAATEDAEVISFCSWPVAVEDFLVVVVLQLCRLAYYSHYRLRKDTVRGAAGVCYVIDTSFLDATITRYLQVCADQLSKPDPGSFFRIIEDEGEIFRAAAKNLMYAPAHAGGNLEGLHGLYEACNVLSTLKYEGTEGTGELVLARPDHPDLSVGLELVAPVPLHDFGAVRKLLQVADGDLGLLCDAAKVYGLGRVLPRYDPAREDVFVVRFSKHFVWELSHAGNALMHLRYGEPCLQLPGFPVALFRRDLPRIFVGITRAQVERLCALAELVAAQEHGAMLVVSAAGATEAARLSHQCTRVRPFELSAEVIPRVTAIDGAVLADLDGRCHAIGVILDGLGSHRCTPSRGARYNSAVRYAYGRSDCMIVVKSEDGMIDLFPTLMPCIRRSELAAALAKLRALAGRPAVELEELSAAVQWFDAHRFYLAPEVCAEVNRLWREADRRLPADAWHLQYEEFVPHEDMNDSYFLPD